MTNDERELQLLRASLAINRRLRVDGFGYTTALRSSCAWATENEFQAIIDGLVKHGLARREQGKRRGERIVYVQQQLEVETV